MKKISSLGAIILVFALFNLVFFSCKKDQPQQHLLGTGGCDPLSGGVGHARTADPSERDHNPRARRGRARQRDAGRTDARHVPAMVLVAQHLQDYLVEYGG